jgi:HSP20 family protein
MFWPMSTRERSGEVGTLRQHPADEFRREFDVLFNRMFGGWSIPFDQDFGGARHLAFDVDEKDNEIVVRAEVPGFEPNELDIQLDDGVLTVKAEKQQKDAQGERYQSYRRAVTLPRGVDADRVKASYANGVLEMHMPRTDQGKAKRIAVTAGQPGADKGDSKKK